MRRHLFNETPHPTSTVAYLFPPPPLPLGLPYLLLSPPPDPDRGLDQLRHGLRLRLRPRLPAGHQRVHRRRHQQVRQVEGGGGGASSFLFLRDVPQVYPTELIWSLF